MLKNIKRLSIGTVVLKFSNSSVYFLISATRKLVQENIHRAHQENKRNYYKQRSADELHYATEKYDPPVSQTKLKRSKTPDFDSQWRRDKEAYGSKYYHSENEKEDHQEYLNKEKKSLQQWRWELFFLT